MDIQKTLQQMHSRLKSHAHERLHDDEYRCACDHIHEKKKELEALREANASDYALKKKQQEIDSCSHDLQNAFPKTPSLFR